MALFAAAMVGVFGMQSAVAVYTIGGANSTLSPFSSDWSWDEGELAPLRTARRLLEEAFRAVDDAPVMTDPKPSHTRKEPAMNCQRK